MMAKQLEDYINEYIRNGEIQGRAFLTGEYKEGNKAFSKMEKIIRKVEKIEENENFYLTILKKSDDANTITCCCGQMLKLQIEPQLARKKLEEIKNSKNNHPILVFNAKMFLQEWDRGNIKTNN